MSDKIPVVPIEEAKNEAFSMGRRRFDGIDTDLIDGIEDFNLEPFRSGATYANHTLPTLRALAGFEDSGHGTFQVGRDVAVIDPENVDDLPAMATVVDSQDLLGEIVEAWENGAYEAVRDALAQG